MQIDSNGTPDVLIALLGGLVGSMIGVIATLGITWRGEARQRRARLRAIEHELRANRTIIEACLSGQSPPSALSAKTWERVNVDLALDTPDSVYKSLQNFYWLYVDAEGVCNRRRQAGGLGVSPRIPSRAGGRDERLFAGEKRGTQRREGHRGWGKRSSAARNQDQATNQHSEVTQP